MKTTFSMSGIKAQGVEISDITVISEMSSEEFITLIKSYPELMSMFIDMMERGRA